MLHRKPHLPPTDTELRLLQVLWDRGPSTVRQIHAELDRGTAYTTALKLLQIMHEKGLVERDESSRAHVYAAVPDREAVEQGLVGALLERAFAGSASRLVLRALSVRSVSSEERRAIEELLQSLPATESGAEPTNTTPESTATPTSEPEENR